MELLQFDLDIILRNRVYADFYSFIAEDAISKTARYEVMYDIFAITHNFDHPLDLYQFKDLDLLSLETDPDFRNHKLNEVRKILNKETKKDLFK